MLNKLYFQVILASTLVAAAAAIPAYEYGVNDDYSKANFKKTETQDASGNVAGSFKKKRTAIHEDGFIADRSYEGVPQYPAEKAYAPKAAPAYAPTPAPETTKLKRMKKSAPISSYAPAPAPAKYAPPKPFKIKRAHPSLPLSYMNISHA